MSGRNSANPRKTAVEILRRMNVPFGGGQSDAWSKILLDSKLSSSGMTPKDRGLTSAILLGTAERIITLDYYISRLSKRPGSGIDPETLAALRAGIWQLEYADRIPDHAAVYETVGAVRYEVRGFVNGILRAFLKSRGNLPIPEGKDAHALSVRYSVCEGLCAEYIRLWGPERAEKILASYFDRRLDIRTNFIKTTTEALAGRLADEGFEAKPLPTGTGFSVSGDGLPGAIADGDAFVQDAASQIAVAALGAQPGENLLDACACPGSKSFGAASDMNNSGSILCADLHESKLPLITEGASRLGIGIIKTVCRDSSQPEPSFEGRFDRVICDVPCSGYGVISKKPELRYRDPSFSRDLPELQYKILLASSRALKPGGVLVYSTCTVLPAENDAVVDRFLSENPGFASQSFSAGGYDAPDGRLRLLPDGGTDGFFVAKIVKAR